MPENNNNDLQKLSYKLTTKLFVNSTPGVRF